MIINPKRNFELLANAYIEGTISSYYSAEALTINPYQFDNCQQLKTVDFPKATTIGASAFRSCYNLKEINFPLVTNIYQSAFRSCSQLLSVDFPALRSLSSFVFHSCIKLRRFNGPKVVTVGSSAFQDCYNLYSVFIGESATQTSIYSSAFYACSNLYRLYIKCSSVALLQTTLAFSRTPIWSSVSGIYGSIYVPSSLLSQYKSAMVWSSFSDRFVGI